jgi:hypothetical protein
MSSTVEVMNAGVPIVAPPRGEQHVHGRARPASLRLASELVRRQLLELDPTPQDLADEAHLVCLTQRLGPREDVVASDMSVLIQGSRHDGCDVAAGLDGYRDVLETSRTLDLRLGIAVGLEYFGEVAIWAGDVPERYVSAPRRLGSRRSWEAEFRLG